MSQELLQYVEAALKGGSSEDEIRKVLLNAGWRAEDIGAAFVTVRAAKDLGAPPMSPVSPQPAAQMPVEKTMPATRPAEPKRSVLPEVAPRTQTPAQSPIQVISQTKPEPQAQIRPTMSAEMAVMQMGRRSRRKFTSAILVVVLVLLVSGGGIFAYTQHYWPFAAEVPQDLAGETPPPPPVIVDPLGLFADAFGKANYRVGFSGKVSYASNTTSSKTEFSMEFYPESFGLYRSGALVSVSEEKTGNVLMMVSSTLYVVDNKAKTYSNIDTANASSVVANLFRTIFTSASPIGALLKIHKDENVAWTKSGENEWHAKLAKNFLIFPVPDASRPIGIKIVLDPQSNLIATLSMRFDDAAPWQDVAITYETIDDIGGLLVFPKGYKETTLK